MSRRFGDRVVLRDLTASFPAGSLVAVTGPSGSGKTTLLHLLAGLDLPSDGEVDVFGTVLGGLSRTERAAFRRDHIAVVAQQPTLTPFLSARENVELGLGIRGLASDEASTRAGEALAELGLADRADQPVRDLSTGERGRVAIARALAARPSLLLADEPTARLDQANALAVASLLSGLARTLGAAVVCATHDPVVIEQADAEVRLASASASLAASRA